MPPERAEPAHDPDASKLLALTNALSSTSAPDGRQTRLSVTMDLTESVPEPSYIASIPIPPKGIENLPKTQLDALAHQLTAFASTMYRRPNLVITGPKVARQKMYQAISDVPYYGKIGTADGKELSLIIYLSAKKAEAHQ